MRAVAKGSGSCGGLLLAGLLTMLAAGCADEEPAPVTVVPEPVPDPTPPPPELQLQAQPDPAAGRCASGFTQNDATVAFSIITELDAGPCSFEGVRATGSRLNLRWKDSDGVELKVILGTAGCDEGQPHGPFTLGELPPGLKSCGPLQDGLIDAIDNARLPLPTHHERDGPGRPGPDGDGVPNAARPDTIPGQKSAPEQLPPARPPDE